jgi:outer membrane protein assembly factor BamE
MRHLPVLASMIAVTTLAACSLPTMVAEKVQPYRIDVRQGNYVDQAMVSQLRKGMTQEQVRFVLGTPLLVDVFHSNRWDYIYRFKRGTGSLESRKLSVYFVEGKLDSVDGDVVAGAPPEAGSGAPPARVIDLTNPTAEKPKEESKSWWRFW